MISICVISRHLGYTFVSCSTELSKKFQLLIKTKMLKTPIFLVFFLKKNSDVVFIMLINDKKMPIIVGILTMISLINFMLS